jgi:septum formation protein
LEGRGIDYAKIWVDCFKEVMGNMSELLLASASIRRKELLDQIGVQFKSASMDIDESVLEGEIASVYVERLAREKAQAGLSLFSDKVILAADTTVALSGRILGKPEDESEAEAMLRDLSGANHQVLTGIAVAKYKNGEKVIESQVVETEVSFLSLSDQQIVQYVKSGEPMDKAGAYGIQGKAALFVGSIQGSYSNVVGLPLAETGQLLQRFGVPIWSS